MKRIFIFTFLCLLYSCNVLNLDGSKPIIEIKDGAFDPNTGLDAWGYDPLSTTHISAWDMTGGDLTLTLPISDDLSYKYDFTIDWGDGTVESIGDPTTTGFSLRGSSYSNGTEPPEISHTYTTAGVYTIEITGTFEEWSFKDITTSTSDDNVNLIRVHSFGDLGYKRLGSAFKACTNLTHFAGGYTQNVTSMDSMFLGSSALTSLDLSNFNTEKVAFMGNMFTGLTLLNHLNVTNWDTRTTNGIRGSPLSFTNWLDNTPSLNKTTGIVCNDPDGIGNNTVNGVACN